MRARNLKPSIHKNEVLARLGSDHYKLFTGLFGMADRKGRLEDRPERIEAEIFPFKFQQVNVEKMLHDLFTCQEQFIIRYQREGKRFIQVTNFLKHNCPHFREAESLIPAPVKPEAGLGLAQGNNEASLRKAALNPSSLFPLPSSLFPQPESCKKQKSVRTKFVRPAPNEVTEYAKSIGFNLDGQNFVDFYDSKGWVVGKAPMRDWRAAVRTWKRGRGQFNQNGGKHAGAATPVPGKYDHLS